eukprot:808406-Prorocentrum_minimum.AAC.2
MAVTSSALDRRITKEEASKPNSFDGCPTLASSVVLSTRSANFAAESQDRKSSGEIQGPATEEEERSEAGRRCESRRVRRDGPSEASVAKGSAYLHFSQARATLLKASCDVHFHWPRPRLVELGGRVVAGEVEVEAAFE